jgi:hypothetical protein
MASRKLARKIDMEAEREAKALVWFKQNGLSHNPSGASRKFFHGTSRKKRLPLPRARGGPAGGSESGSFGGTGWLSGCHRGRGTRQVSPGAGKMFPYPGWAFHGRGVAEKVVRKAREGGRRIHGLFRAVDSYPQWGKTSAVGFPGSCDPGNTGD